MTEIINITKRKNIFMTKINIFIFIILFLSTITCFLINNYVYKDIFSWGGVIVLSLFFIFVLSYRNYSFIMQLTGKEFIDQKKIISLIYYLIIINFFFIIISFFIPEKYINNFIGNNIASAYIHVFIFFILSVIINSLNLFLPVWLRQRELFQEESEIIKSEKEELMQKFQELDHEKLEQLAQRQKDSNDETKHEQITLTIIEERMAEIQKFLKFSLQNQLILLSRQYQAANKLMITIIFFIFIFIGLLSFISRALILY